MQSKSRLPMQEFFRTHPKTKWTGITALGLLAVVVIFLALFDWNLLRGPLARKITAATGRETSINGDLKVHLWSWNPSAEVNDLRINNTPWADRDLMFGAKRISVSVSLGRLLRGQIVLPEVALLEPIVNLERDAKGRASWELGTKTGKPKQASDEPAKIPTIRRLLIDGGKLHVVDQIRKLSFSGSLIASDRAGKDDSAAFKIDCSGTLNEKPFKLNANGGPLLDLEPSKPYSFSAHLLASDIKLDTHVTVLKPFDLGLLDVTFDVSGNDLADVFYLTGLALPNTPHYELGARVHVQGSKYTIDDLKGQLGSSDISGSGAVEMHGGKPKLSAKLTSKNLNIVDLAPTLGQPATPPSRSLASGEPNKAKGKTTAAKKSVAASTPPASNGLLLPDADLQVERVRGMDADVSYRAESVNAPKVPMKSVQIHVVIDGGLLTIDPLSFVLDAGKFAGRVQIDARPNVPVSDIEMRIDDVDLAQFKSASMKDPPLTGNMLGRFKFHGAGSSIHKLAGASNGSMSVVIPHGQIREAFAELTGINVLKGLGLLLSKEEGKTDIRCGIIDFKDTQGSLNTTTVYVDTTNVLITGRGKIDLGSEKVEVALQGDPKKIRFLRLRSPISLHGTLLNPGVGLEADKLALQAGAATALGVLLTPAAAALAFIDPGLGKDKDCSTVLAQANDGVQN
jgi:uncharacterized protein involved in outer membrane biogenesis